MESHDDRTGNHYHCPLCVGYHGDPVPAVCGIPGRETGTKVHTILGTGIAGSGIRHVSGVLLKRCEIVSGKSWVAGTAGYYACDFASFMEAEYVAFHRRRYRLLYATGSIYVLIGSFVPLFQETTENGQLFIEKCRKT